MAHIQDALRAGHKSIVVTTVDTDMVIISIGTHHHTFSLGWPDTFGSALLYHFVMHLLAQILRHNF